MLSYLEDNDNWESSSNLYAGNVVRAAQITAQGDHVPKVKRHKVRKATRRSQPTIRAKNIRATRLSSYSFYVCYEFTVEDIAYYQHRNYRVHNYCFSQLTTAAFRMIREERWVLGIL
ncbi:hypothetical protein RB195_016915 [Necator americanus]|uniref:Uncharacterized protein n=1 Tax=Necator americanus TaxID=51031 RepID=A0ABR1C4Z0_NECAM